MGQRFSGGLTGMRIGSVTGQVREMVKSAGVTLRSVPLGSDTVEIRVGDRSAVVPISCFHALLEVLKLLELGHGARIHPMDDELTTEEAARVLGVSRGHLVGLLEKGEIPFRKVGPRRRISVFDLTAYQEKRDRGVREARVELDKFASQLRTLLR